MATIICPKCGTENPDSAMNCTQCRINLQFALDHPEELPISSEEEGEPKKGRRSINIPCLITTAILLVMSLVCGWIALRVFIWMGGSLAECYSEYYVQTYLDENGNGIRDTGEPPLPRVYVFAGIDNSEKPRPDEMALTDPNGEVSINFGMMNAHQLNEYGGDMKIYVEIPSGYVLTTPMSYAIKACEFGKTYYFGFIAQPDLEPKP